jgi:hypothetical protein
MKYQELLDLFVSVHKRQPKDGEEFANYCEFVEKNSQSTNSRGDINSLL